MRLLLTTTFLLISTAAISMQAAAQASSATPPSVAEQYLFTQANAERAQRGISPLRWDVALYRAAGLHADQMADRGSISHQYPGEPELTQRCRQAGARFSAVAENVAEAPTAVRIHQAWMDSPGHRDNLLDPTLDAVGIRVITRGGQLYAVEDFDRTVQTLSLDDQERAVAGLLQAAPSIAVLPTTPDARRTCSMETGFAGTQRPLFVMRYTAVDLSQLPDALKARLATGKYHQAVVGACPVRDSQDFSAFNIAVLLYP